MKILLLGLTKIKYMPYARFYLEQLCVPGNEVHLIFWNRDEKPEPRPEYDVILHEFTCFQKDEEHPFKKLRSFKKYRTFAGHILDGGDFDLVVVLHSLTGAVVYDKLKRYSGRYILDYRDITYEKFRPYKRLIASMVNNSALTYVSSDAFRSSLPQSDKILASHNITPGDYHERPEHSRSSGQLPLRIAFWGYIRHAEVNLNIIKRLGNDPRFELHYYGREQKTAQQLKTYCAYNTVKNVFFHGEYTPGQRVAFAACTDLVHNMYDNDEVMKRAVSNKYYDALVFRLPQLCTEGSYMGTLVKEKKIGLALNPSDEDFADKVFDYCSNLSMECFDEACERELERVLAEYSASTAALNALCDTLK